ncbi:response regulator [Rhizobium lentis]|nr:response regulator [Rhizobium lentis]MBX4975006.1 response regulator [Rhizobium lentis]MBX4989761.1 response regulator [Rhizobium lentis]MBX5008262.1 response regulator [Rhizobium lentis]MBX5014983.1 response regulator [Rhizobium lentis]
MRWRGPEKTPKVLISIIDDDESIREGLGGLLHWLEFEVAIFASAHEFLASPALAKCACIVSDVQMPQMTGFELHGHLLAMGHDIPTILITAYPNDDARARASTAGIVCYLRKPFDTNVLIECIRSAIAPGTA